MKFHHLLIAFLFLLPACSDESDDMPPVRVVMKGHDKGYKRYIKSCVRDTADEKICICQADILQRYLTDDKINIIADAGEAASNGDVNKIDQVMAEQKDVLKAMKQVSAQAKACATLAQ